ncbi:MAG: transcription elongation factor GreA [Clostridia bacterium]
MELENRQILVTEAGHQKLEADLEYLKGEKRMEVAERIKTAIEFGDISENSEYDDAKEEQAQLESKIIELENTLKMAKVVDEDQISIKTVGVGVTVTLQDYEYDEEVQYSIVGSTEVDLAAGKISNESPVGKAIIGKKKGDVVEVETPAGIAKYKILTIKRK